VPAPRTPRLTGEGGLGLHMLKALAGEVRTQVHDEGKTVSVVVDLH
jgi:anti-sigma regulatory factor (Ser/Thr protein kinase)